MLISERNQCLEKTGKYMEGQEPVQEKPMFQISEKSTAM